MKKHALTFLSGLSLLMVGCGGYDSMGLSDKNSVEAKRYEIRKALDEGEYDFVISALEADPTYGGAFTEEEGKLNLAAAYVGKAGFDINDIVNEMVSTATTTTQNQKFTQFIQALAKNVGVKGSLFLKKATVKYNEITNACNSTSLNDIEKDACFYKGIVDAATAATTVAAIVKDVEKWINPSGCSDDANQNGVGDDADVSACAISYAVNGSCSIPGVSYASLGYVTFTKDSSSFSFELLKVDVSSPNCENPNTRYRLIDSGNKTVVVTEGYCKTDFTPCGNLDINVGCYPCPVVDFDTNRPLNITETIVDTIESAVEVITAITPNDTDVNNAVNQYLQEVCGTDQVCTEEEIANYLQSI